MNRTIIALATSCLTAALAIHAGAAAAQQQPTPRQGLAIGFGVGAGNISCSATDDACNDARGAGGLSFHVGGMINPRLAIGLDVWMMAHSNDDLTITHGFVTAAAKYWVAPRLWLMGGVGAAQASFTLDILGVQARSETDSVPGVIGGIGYEIVASPGFALDLELRGGTGFYDEDRVRAHNASLGVGFTWF